MFNEMMAALVYTLPSAIPMVLGFIFGGILFNRARGAAVLLLIGSTLILLQGVFQVISQTWLLALARDGVISLSAYGVATGIVNTLLYLAILIFLMCAAFAGRRPAASAMATDYPSPPPLDGQTVKPARGSMVLALGLVGIVLFAPLGIAAWIIGLKDLSAMRAGRMDPAGRSLTITGTVLGIVATLIMLVAAVLFVYALSQMNFAPH
tara:strand:- start:27752 stop:28375 length:624 start_codon:yes stop_codon:yes gene_type:complete